MSGKKKVVKKATNDNKSNFSSSSMALPSNRKDILKLKRITISGYKSISADCPINIELGDINILLGANGSGKSNIISFF